jgi:hypothetical protein
MVERERPEAAFFAESKAIPQRPERPLVEQLARLDIAHRTGDVINHRIAGFPETA